MAVNLCQLARNEPIAVFAAIYNLQNNLIDPVFLIQALGIISPEGDVAFKVIAQHVPAVLPFIYECVSKVKDAALLANFIALAKKEKIATHQLAGVMDAFQNAVSKMDKASALQLQRSITDASRDNKSSYRPLYLKKGFTSIFQSYGETKASIAMKNALNSRLKEFDQPLMNHRLRVTR